MTDATAAVGGLNGLVAPDAELVVWSAQDGAELIRRPRSLRAAWVP